MACCSSRAPDTTRLRQPSRQAHPIPGWCGRSRARGAWPCGRRPCGIRQSRIPFCRRATPRLPRRRAIAFDLALRNVSLVDGFVDGLSPSERPCGGLCPSHPARLLDGLRADPDLGPVASPSSFADALVNCAMPGAGRAFRQRVAVVLDEDHSGEHHRIGSCARAAASMKPQVPGLRMCAGARVLPDSGGEKTSCSPRNVSNARRFVRSRARCGRRPDPRQADRRTQVQTKRCKSASPGRRAVSWSCTGKIRRETVYHLEFRVPPGVLCLVPCALLCTCAFAIKKKKKKKKKKIVNSGNDDRPQVVRHRGRTRSRARRSCILAFALLAVSARRSV